MLLILTNAIERTNDYENADILLNILTQKGLNLKQCCPDQSILDTILQKIMKI